MKTLEEIFEIIESKGIGIDKYEEDNKLCGYELNTYTYGGVNQIIFLDFRDDAGDANNVEDFVRIFTDYVESIDIDEEVDLNRQSQAYKQAFTLSQALVDFQDWKDDLMELVENLQ